MLENSNKRIAKNTIMLYVRMFVAMIVSLFTSRIILQTLGVTNFGIYNVVGGVVAMFSFIHGSMAGATQRYLNIDLARGDTEHLKLSFRTSMQIYVFIALLVFLLAETIGLWFVLNKLVIPEERMLSAMWVYQISIIAAMIGIINLPYDAAIIAHERMNIYAAISIMDVVLKLIIVYLLLVFPFDKLIVYAILLLCVNLIDRFVYNAYCKKHFEEINFSFKIDKGLFKEMLSFSGWTLWGNIAGVLFTQGVNILLNLFFGPVVNAARGISVQVQGIIQGFAGNIQTAVNPQITKSYAQNDLERMHKLMIASSKICFFLLFTLSLPVFISADYILHLWLGVVPDHTVSFVRLVLIIMLTETLANPYIVANYATGKVKVYQAICGGMLLCILPFSYIALRLGGNPESVYIVHGVIAVLTQLARVLLMRNLIHFSLRKYVCKVIGPVLLVALCTPIFPLLANTRLSNDAVGFLSVTALCVVCCIFFCFLFGFSSGEKLLVKNMVRSVLHKFH